MSLVSVSLVFLSVCRIIYSTVFDVFRACIINELALCIVPPGISLVASESEHHCWICCVVDVEVVYLLFELSQIDLTMEEYSIG